MEYLRLILKENTTQDNLSTIAWNHNWDFYDSKVGSGADALTKTWITQDQKTTIRYTEDELIGIRYLHIEGGNVNKLLAEISDNLSFYTKQEIEESFLSAKTDGEFIRAIHKIGIIAVPQIYDETLYNYFEKALKHTSAEVRDAGILASAYVGWQELISLLKEISETDPDSETKAFAQKAVVSINKHNKFEKK